MSRFATALAARETALATLATVVVVVLGVVGWLAPVEEPVADLLLRMPNPRPPVTSSFVAVVIDNPSIEARGPLPWPRARLAEVVRAAWRSGARAVVLDLILSEPGDEAGDADLARALGGGPVRLAAVVAVRGGWLLPLERFGGRGVAAHAHAEVAGDGVVRTVAASKQSEGVALPALGVAAARLAGWRGAVAPGQLLRPDFRQPPLSIPTWSADRLIAGDLPPAALDGQVVFVGVTASGAGDRFVVPVGAGRRPSPGVLTHAAVASAIFRDGLLERMPAGWAWVAVFAVALVVQRLRSRAGRLRPVHLAVVAAIVVVGSPVALWIGKLLVPVVSLLVGVAVSALAREALESRQALQETDAVLRSLVEHGEGGGSVALPTGVHGQLRLVRQLQAQLLRDRDLRRTLLDALEEGVVLWDDDGRPLVRNDSLRALWGGTPHRDQLVLAAGMEEPCRDAASVAEVERGGRFLEAEVRVLGRGQLGLLRDVTVHRELERQRRQTQRLVSHELKTPLASIAGFGTMLERYSLSRVELNRVAGLIRGEAERLGEMVRTFLDLERLGGGHWAREQTRVDLGEIVAERCELAATASSGRGPEIEVSVSPATITGVPQLLAAVVDNLVGNAVKYSAPDTVVRVEVDCDADRVVLAVRDQGPGIPEDAVARVFERFYRVPGAAVSGSGLGLALVKEVAEWHGAEVGVASEVGQGSLFTVSFPEAAEDASDVPCAAPGLDQVGELETEAVAADDSPAAEEVSHAGEDPGR